MRCPQCDGTPAISSRLVSSPCFKMNQMSHKKKMLQLVRKERLGITAAVFIGFITLLSSGACCLSPAVWLVLTTVHCKVIITHKWPLNLTSAVRMASCGLESSSSPFCLSLPSESHLVVQFVSVQSALNWSLDCSIDQHVNVPIRFLDTLLLNLICI